MILSLLKTYSLIYCFIIFSLLKFRYEDERRERNRELGIPEPLESVTLPDAEQFQLPDVDHHNRGRRGRDQPRFQRGPGGMYFGFFFFLV